MCAQFNSVPSTSAWRVIAASVTGTSHQRTGKTCEDAHAYRFHDTESLLLLVAADGAGTAAFAAQGAEAAVRAAIHMAEKLLLKQREPDQEDQWRSILTLILQTTHNTLKELAETYLTSLATKSEQNTLTRSMRKFATTLLLTIVTPNWIAALQVGDGAIVLHKQGEVIVSLKRAEQQEYLNETVFLTDADYLQLADYTILPRADLRGIALLTDGLQPLAMHMADNSPHEPFFKQLFKFSSKPEATETELRRFLASERVCAHTDDDKTLVLAVY